MRGAFSFAMECHMSNSRDDDNGAGRRSAAPVRTRRTSMMRQDGDKAREARARAAEVAGARLEVQARDEESLLAADRGRAAELEALVRREIELLGEDPDREALRKTPTRVAKALSWLTRGYGLDAAQVIGDALFEEAHESMIIVRDIELYSLC